MKEQRAGIRLPMKLPVLITWKTASGRYRKTQADTANLSGNGLFLLTPRRFRPLTPIRCRVLLPLGVAGISVELICLGRVVRCSGARETPAVAAIIDEYELRPAPG
jgi:PilZ domain-containing protein